MKSPENSAYAETDLKPYHDRCIALLRRYFRMSMEVGRLPSLLGREVFRTRVTSYSAQSFEDAVIFVHDVERCLEKLDPASQLLIARIVLQNFDYDETAKLLHCTWRTIANRFPRALDELCRIFLDAKMMEDLPCQEPKSVTFRPSS
jgi:DNA-directed RNA polymerase specialized sigma24 family protein